MAVDPWVLGPLRSFEISGRLLSFTRAAKALNLTQSAVSQQIRLLEERLGFPLFVRHAQGLRLTRKGSELLHSVQSGFEGITSTIARFESLNTSLVVNCLPSLALHWLVPRLTTFYQENLNASVRVTAELRSLNPLMMKDEGIDIGIRYEPREQIASNAEVFMQEYLFPVATPEYLDRHRALKAQGSCLDVTFLHDASPWSGASEYVEWHVWAKNHRPEWLPALAGPQFNLASMMISAALNHQGVTLGRTAIVFDELKSGRLVDVFGAYVRAPASYFLLCPAPNCDRSAAFRKWIFTQAAIFTQDCGTLLPEINSTELQ